VQDSDDEFSRRHVIHARGGRLSTEPPVSDAAQIGEILDAAEAAPNGLVLHIHGGLVTPESGIESARILAASYSRALGHPAFLVWDSGFLAALQAEVTDPVGRMLQSFADVIVDVRRDPVEGCQAVLTALEQRITAHPELIARAVAVRIAGPIPPGQERSIRSAFAGRLDSPGYATLFQGVGLTLPQRLAAVLADVYDQVGARERSGRMHGAWQSIQEELIRKLRIGAAVWAGMRADMAAAFDADDRAVGTVLAQGLAARATDGRLQRLTVVAHSAGSVMACALLDALSGVALDIDVVFLAPAVSHARFYDTLRRHGHQASGLRRFRMFTMRDELERADTVIHDRFEFYQHSLLYLISGALETVPDRPLLGMERFLLAELDPALSHGERAHRDAIAEFLAAFGTAGDSGLVLATTAPEARPGERSAATSHGDFIRDPDTLASIVDFITTEAATEATHEAQTAPSSGE
jgi:hypothetical protein